MTMTKRERAYERLALWVEINDLAERLETLTDLWRRHDPELRQMHRELTDLELPPRQLPLAFDDPF